jgi:hypothetical protein
MPLGNVYALILKLALYWSRRCLILGGRGVERMALQMVGIISSVHFKCNFGHSDDVGTVPRYFLGRVSSCNIIGIGVFSTRTLATRDRRAAFHCTFRLPSCSACM